LASVIKENTHDDLPPNEKIMFILLLFFVSLKQNIVRFYLLEFIDFDICHEFAAKQNHHRNNDPMK
jgi:hypothetical protein